MPVDALAPLIPLDAAVDAQVAVTVDRGDVVILEYKKMRGQLHIQRAKYRRREALALKSKYNLNCEIEAYKELYVNLLII